MLRRIAAFVRLLCRGFVVRGAPVPQTRFMGTEMGLLAATQRKQTGLHLSHAPLHRSTPRVLCLLHDFADQRRRLPRRREGRDALVSE
jgi:hypothetical protein